MASSALILTALFAGRIPATSPTSVANTSAASMSQGGMIEMAALPPPSATVTPDETAHQRVALGREVIRAATGRDWPICPLHHTHALELRDQQWFCAEDAAFVAPLGRLRRQRPAPQP